MATPRRLFLTALPVALFAGATNYQWHYDNKHIRKNIRLIPRDYFKNSIEEQKSILISHLEQCNEGIKFSDLNPRVQDSINNFSDFLHSNKKVLIATFDKKVETGPFLPGYRNYGFGRAVDIMDRSFKQNRVLQQDIDQYKADLSRQKRKLNDPVRHIQIARRRFVELMHVA